MVAPTIPPINNNVLLQRQLNAAFAQVEVQAALNSISSTRGTILYRGASAWVALAPGVSGQFLKTQGAGADPVWSDLPP